MHNLYARGNAIFSFMLWVMAFVTAGCFLSTVMLDYTTEVNITVNNAKVQHVIDYAAEAVNAKSDLGLLDFSVNVDFSNIFNWNVKQVFVYLLAEYTTAKNEVNQVVLWDKIVLRSERVVLDERDLKNKYFFVDDGSNLRDHPNVTLLLRYNVVPNAGYLRLAQGHGSTTVKFPSTYSTKR